jgi:hypothetical protein
LQILPLHANTKSNRLSLSSGLDSLSNKTIS